MKYFFSLLSLLVIFFYSAIPAMAIEDPLATPNNKVGIHILFPSELSKAAELVNSNGGDWGYVTIPIQVGDKDLEKWQSFFDNCQKLHLIPIIRLATENDYFNTTVWRVPTFAEVLDFANFLNSLDWPTKNRYILVFNEVNRGDEWGGTPDPTAYAQILSYAVTAFKAKNPDFFIISAGMDNAAANTGTAMNEYSYLAQMNQAVPGIFNQIDGIGSHSYPNPAFDQPPWVQTNMSITSFRYEKSLVDSMTTKSLPVFITETGWDKNVVPESTVASYLSNAFTSVWNDKSIVAVTPFLLEAGAGPFTGFSLLDPSGAPNMMFKAVQSLTKVKGLPALNPEHVLAVETGKIVPVPTEHFTYKEIISTNTKILAVEFKNLFKWLLLTP